MYKKHFENVVPKRPVLISVINVMDTVPKAIANLESGDDSLCEIASIIAIQKEAKDYVSEIDPLMKSSWKTYSTHRQCGGHKEERMYTSRDCFNHLCYWIPSQY